MKRLTNESTKLRDIFDQCARIRVSDCLGKLRNLLLAKAGGCEQAANFEICGPHVNPSAVPSSFTMAVIRGVTRQPWPCLSVAKPV